MADRTHEKLNHEEQPLCKVENVQLYARTDDAGRPVEITAIDEDEDKILSIADRLHRLGYGVRRERSPRSGRVYYTLSASWADDGVPPEDPIEAGS